MQTVNVLRNDVLEDARALDRAADRVRVVRLGAHEHLEPRHRPCPVPPPGVLLPDEVVVCANATPRQRAPGRADKEEGDGREARESEREREPAETSARDLQNSLIWHSHCIDLTWGRPGDL